MSLCGRCGHYKLLGRRSFRFRCEVNPDAKLHIYNCQNFVSLEVDVVGLEE